MFGTQQKSMKERKPLMMGRLILVVCVMAFWRSAAQAATLYVATTGSDNSTNPYSTSSPFYSLSKATSWASPGDVIRLRGGTYQYANEQWIGESGNSSNRITIQSYNNEWAVLDGSKLGSTNSVIGIGGSYITLQWLEVRNSKGTGISIWGGGNNLISNCKSHDNQRQGVYIGFDDKNLTTTPCANNKVETSSFWNNCRINSARTATGGWPIALASYMARNTQFVNCDVYSNWGEGIGMGLTKGGYVGSNRSHDNFSVDIYLDNATSVTVENNRCVNQGQTNYYRNGKPANGIGMANEWYDFANPLRYNEIKGNFLQNCPSGIYYGNYDNYDAGMKDTSIHNNSFANCTRNLAIDFSPGSSNNSIYSNP